MRKLRPGVRGQQTVAMMQAGSGPLPPGGVDPSLGLGAADVTLFFSLKPPGGFELGTRPACTKDKKDQKRTVP